MNILIVDDHTVVRQGLRQILEDARRTVRVAEAANASAALAVLDTVVWDVVVLDISLPDRSGIEVLKAIRARHPKLPVLMLSTLSEEQLAPRVLEAGASGYLSKESAPEQLLAAIDHVVRGGRYLSPAMTEKLATSGPARATALHERLSQREFSVLRLIASGKPLTAIGAELGVSVKTVSTYRTRILEKMEMDSNAELIRYAMTHGLGSE